MRAKKAIIIKVMNTGKINLIHLSIGTLHMLNIAISPPSVGLIKFDKPSPIGKAKMVICLVSPKDSPKGSITGKVAKACPLPDGIKKLIMVCDIDMLMADAYKGKS